MKKIFIGMVLALISTLSASAQTKNITVSGRVIEDTKEPVAQATVQLLSLPDSTYVTGIATSTQGYFTLPKVAAGEYLLKISYIGYKSKWLPLQLSSKTPDTKVGTLTLETDAVMLAEAVITAEAPMVQIIEDTIAFNSSAYRTPEGAMLEELVKKLPGAEVDDDGNVKINGKDISKIMVNGKEFFGGDVETGLKNLPVDMIENLKTYDKKSDLARITGIDDGEEETVLDLTVKKGMNQGVFGNIDLSYGTKDRYSERAMINYFRESTQVSLIGNANNVNNQGFSGGGGGPRWNRNNGLTTIRGMGINFATENSKIELGGSARINYRKNDAISTGYTENFLTGSETSSFSNSNSSTLSRNLNFNMDFRMEWKPDSMTNIIFRPNFSYGNSRSESDSKSGTFNSDPYALIANPNDYLDLDELMGTTDPLESIRVNTSNNLSSSKGNSISTDAALQINRKLNSRGRNITFRGMFNYGDNNSDQYSLSDTRYFSSDTADDNIRRYITSPSTNYSLSGQFTYSEPIAKATYLQFSYRFKYSHNESDKNTYDLSNPEEYVGVDDYWNFGDPLPNDYREHRDADNSKYAEYKTYEHDARISLRFIRSKYQLNAGLSFQPQNTKLTYKKGEIDTLTTRNVFNFAPSMDLRIRFSPVSQLRATYRGSSTQPSMENLLPVTDDSNPLNITSGNPGLKPSFTHNLRFFYNTYDADHQRGIFSHVNWQLTQNSISNVREYVESTGGWKSTPENINGNWSVLGLFGINSALKNKKFNISSFSDVNYSNNVEFQTNDTENVKNTTTNLRLNERLNGTFRNDWIEFGLNGSLSYSIEKDKLNPDNNQSPYTFSYGANTTFTLPWNMSISTNIANQCRRGYTDSSMNRNELIWNAQIAQTLFKGRITLSAEMYDILKEQSNISRTLTSSGRSVYEYNGINSYGMFHFIYHLNIFGSKAARDRMREERGRFGPGGPEGPGGFGGPGGGPGGGRPGGGRPGGGRPGF